MAVIVSATVNQHLIDPVICIRCNTCESTCPVNAISHDERNYVVDPAICNGCNACIAPCPTGSIDNWRRVRRGAGYTLAEQLGWDELPEQDVRLEDVRLEDVRREDARLEDPGPPGFASSSIAAGARETAPIASVSYGSTLPPWSAAHAYTNPYLPKGREIAATVSGNIRVTDLGSDYDTHHIVLDFGSQPFPVLEGQSIGVIPPGVDAAGRPHAARRYSVASPRNGERPGYNNVSLTVKRVLQDHDGNPVHGIASNYLCDLKVSDRVAIIGPFGASFLMPNHPRSNIVMICTGTGSAPMRAMTERRRRAGGNLEAARLLLFFGARTPKELPYFGPPRKLPADLIDVNLAFSREPGKSKTYVQDLMRERAKDVARHLRDPDSFFYVCGLKAMETGVVQALRDIAESDGRCWEELGPTLRHSGRLHLETY